MSESTTARGLPADATWCEAPADYIVQTYFVLRLVIAGGALLLPAALLLWAAADPAVPMQHSISAFYYTRARAVFVGAVVAIGVALLAYRGYTRGSNLLLNTAGIFAIVVALVPTTDPSTDVTDPGNIIHAVVALAFFIFAALSIVFYGHATVGDIPDPHSQRRYRAVYRVITATVVVLPVIAFVLAWNVEHDATLFIVETAALYAFATFWLIKTYELSRSHSQLKII